MYTTAVKRDFVARHYLIGGDWGAENQEHQHHYQVELQLTGATLDEHGFLVDIVEIARALDDGVDYLRDRTLNDLPEFTGLNPSLEHLSRILCHLLTKHINSTRFSRVRVQTSESDSAWSAYEETIVGRSVFV